MKEKLITFKTAKLARDKGFKTSNNHWTYKNQGEMYYTNTKGGISGEEDTVKIVTQALLQTWLRKKHNIDIMVAPHFRGTTYGVEVFKNREYTNIGASVSFKSYEKALENTLYATLNLI